MDKLQVPEWVKEKIADDGTTSKVSTWIEHEKQVIEWANKTPGHLTGIDCPLCLNRGYFTRLTDDFYRFTEECSCMAKRRSLARLKKSGLSDLLDRYTFDRWNTKQEWQRKVKEMALNYAENPSGWFYMAGRPGTGKTHICTALCGVLIEKGMEVQYLLWRDFSSRAKAVVTDDEEYQRLVEPMKRVKVLYIDDLFKTGKGQEPTTGDTNLAFEILNARYIQGKPTIISSELTVQMILDIDEAIGSRIFEMAKEHYADLSDRENFRLS